MHASLELEWFQLSYKFRTDQMIQVVRQKSRLNDSFLSLGSFNTEEEDGFLLERKNSRELLRKNLL